MAASKKTLPFSRLRYSRSRKNGPLINDLKNAVSKSSIENESSAKNHAYPLYFTVDDLVANRRKKIPGKLPDNLRPLSGKFSVYKSEYKKKFRSFTIQSEDTKNIESWKKKKMKMKEQGLKLEGKIEFNAEYDDSFVEHPVQKTFCMKPRDQLEKPDSSEFSLSTEHKEKYVMFKEARKAALARQSTNLKMEGEFEDNTENKEKFVTPPANTKSELTRRNTTLKLEGDIDLLTEKNEKYKEFWNVQRTKLLRRFSNLEIPREAMKMATEYRGSFTYPENGERAPLIRSMENLHTEGTMEFEPEYKKSYVDFHASYPDIKFRKRNRTECENTNLKNKKFLDLHVKDTIIDRMARKNPSPEYKHSFVRFPVQRPNFKKPGSNLTPPIGLGEKESELNAKYKPFKISNRTESLRPSTHLQLEGKIDLSPEYKRSYINFSNDRFAKQYCNEGNSKFTCDFRNDCAETNKETIPERSFSVLRNPSDEIDCNFCESRINKSAEKRFQKGKRLPVSIKKTDDTNASETSESETSLIRPPFRMEVTNPDIIHKPFEKFKNGKPFVVLDENNNENQWVKNKQKHNSRWSPSWAP